MKNPTGAVIIIGNEVLSGRTQDINLQFLAKRLAALGIELLEARVIPDEETAIITTVNELKARYSYVFTTGGIGFTHDDITAASVAKAFNVPLETNPEALRLLQHYYGENLNNTRRHMALIPQGATLIDNPASKAPGFQIENVFVMAGFPIIMQAMFDTLQSRFNKGAPIHYRTVTCSLPEGSIAEALATIQTQHPQVQIGSYPFIRVGIYGVSFVARGTDDKALSEAVQAIAKMVEDHGGVPIVE